MQKIQINLDTNSNGSFLPSSSHEMILFVFVDFPFFLFQRKIKRFPLPLSRLLIHILCFKSKTFEQ